MRGYSVYGQCTGMTAVKPPAVRLEIPKHFGRRPDAVFLTPTTLKQQALTEAARIQHYAAVAALDEMARRDLSMSWLATRLEENVDHLRRKLYGQVSANLRDVCAWGAHLEIVTVLPASHNSTHFVAASV